MAADDNQYARGVDARKGAVGRVFTAVEPSVFPHAFCNIYIDPEYGFAFTKHPDGSGSKTVQRYLHAVETGDYSVFEGDVDDCLVMNAGDVACAGLFWGWEFTDSVAINQLYIDKKKFTEAINRGFERIKELYREHGIVLHITGGETADLVHQSKNVIVEGDIYARAPVEKVITCQNIGPGDIIFGFRSGGPCKLEHGSNSGIMSNGLTSARLVLMHPEYAQRHPEIAEPRGDPYTGKFRIGDTPAGLGMEVSMAIMSPTRHFPIIAKRLVEICGGRINGIVMNTGGGQTKITRVGSGIQYVKDGLPTPDPLFLLIQSESGKKWEGMYKSFNCGIGLDVIGPPEIEPLVMGVAGEFGVGCRRIGHCEKSKDDKNHLHISSKFGKFDWDEE